ncbi:ATPase, T2SS/T4P/T4SS family [Paludicola sp. MB14-C6]|uniref:ATPase, T2SS/T4P/T4SS family n=1 Tax=Paludihabitans sp. MB14-C6 TaxID=3070656 RepID=UPI0027DE1D0C|nr:ATPase, T2SS/T4P/T4SS family [Paludicola sp. MB14-C6]WMJ24318.1 ATPase, T2SS/T4P/T4SS family [Paludicola sp. MB14-C6]
MSNILEIQKHIKRTLPVSYEMLMQELQLKIVHDLWQVHQQNISALDRKDKVMNYLMKQLEDRKTTYEGYTKLEIAEKLYNDIEQYSVLTPYLDPVNVSVEGININSWKDIRVKYFGGKSEKVQGFLNPQHGIDIIKRMLEKEAGITIDNAIPTAEASLNSNIRITALISPIVREDVGVVAYIRKLRDKVFNDDEYVQNGFATKKVLNFIHTATKRGVSALFLGKVDTGKTTLVKHALDCLPDDMQVITIESGAREMNLVKYDEHGNVRNNVVHLLTREHTDEEKNITQEKLVVKALRLNPDILSVAEMRDSAIRS